jgi:hypothetical protein
MKNEIATHFAARDAETEERRVLRQRFMVNLPSIVAEEVGDVARVCGSHDQLGA